jgi:cytochrome c oxidase subunit II
VRRFALALAIATLLAACGGGETVAPLPETVEGTVPTATEEAGEDGETAAPEGDPEAGREVFLSAGCGSCHTVAEAGTSAEVGPNLDESLEGRDAQFIHESIVDPDAEIAEGFSGGIMPKNYNTQLSEQQLADLVAFLLPER